MVGRWRVASRTSWRAATLSLAYFARHSGVPQFSCRSLGIPSGRMSGRSIRLSCPYPAPAVRRLSAEAVFSENSRKFRGWRVAAKLLQLCSSVHPPGRQEYIVELLRRCASSCDTSPCFCPEEHFLYAMIRSSRGTLAPQPRDPLAASFFSLLYLLFDMTAFGKRHTLVHVRRVVGMPAGVLAGASARAALPSTSFATASLVR